MSILTRIVTGYRQWHLIGEWITDPALRQEGVRWMVVNDAPEDACPGELRAALERSCVELVTPRANLGRSGARNLGAERCATPWVEHIDGDDLALPFPVESLARAEDARADLVLYSELEFSEGDPERRLRESGPGWTRGAKTYWSFLFPGYAPVHPHPAGTAWRREAFLDLGGYDLRATNGEDLLLLQSAWIRKLEALHWPAPKQAYRVHARTNVRGRDHTYAHYDTLLRLRARAEPDQARALDLLIGRQYLFNLEHALKSTLRHPRPILRFLKAKATGEFLRFNQ